MKNKGKPGHYQKGNTTCYQAEYLRYSILDGVARENWEPVEISKQPIGIPASRPDGPMLDVLGYQTYEQAQALCWWYIANWRGNHYGRPLNLPLTNVSPHVGCPA